MRIKGSSMNRASFRRFFMGLTTLTGFAQRGFFIPYRYAGGITDTVPGSFSTFSARLDASSENFLDVMTFMDEHEPALLSIGSTPPPSPRWSQDWFPGLDGAAAYCLIRKYKPARIIEVGSGHSTRFFAQAVKDEGLQTNITAIDPAPRADLHGLGVSCVRSTVQDVSLGIFQVLDRGDVLSIDSSHILMPGTDVDVLFNRIIPTLPSGVLMHIHDVFLPDGYPSHWQWRGYNEQLGVAPMLEGNKAEILWASHYVRNQMNTAIQNSVAGKIPLLTGALESSLWFRKG